MSTFLETLEYVFQKVETRGSDCRTAVSAVPVDAFGELIERYSGNTTSGNGFFANVLNNASPFSMLLEVADVCPAVLVLTSVRELLGDLLLSGVA